MGDPVFAPAPTRLEPPNSTPAEKSPGPNRSSPRTDRRGDAHAEPASRRDIVACPTRGPCDNGWVRTNWPFLKTLAVRSDKLVPPPSAPRGTPRGSEVTAEDSAAPRTSHAPAVPVNAHPRLIPDTFAPRFWNISLAHTWPCESLNTTTSRFVPAPVPCPAGSATVIFCRSASSPVDAHFTTTPSVQTLFKNTSTSSPRVRPSTGSETEGGHGRTRLASAPRVKVSGTGAGSSCSVSSLMVTDSPSATATTVAARHSPPRPMVGS
mmetsp:Transcript_13197/g.49343  ORF Transcript_13197/g.49343 Transcript_13197/m.49343 type:complete len:265 (-) Transcript_13197:595-1389(-)